MSALPCRACALVALAALAQPACRDATVEVSQAGAALTTGPTEPVDLVISPVVAADVLRVDGATPTTVAFPVTGGAPLVIQLGSPSTDLVIEAIDPAGAVTTVPSDGRHVRDDGTGADYALTVPAPAAGTWQLRVAAPAGVAASVVYEILDAPDVGLGVDVAPVARAGEPAVVTAFVLDGEVLQAAPTLTLRVLGPDGAPVAAPPLGDDGRDGDRVAADGLFASLAVLDAPGAYLATVVARGATTDGRAYQRTWSAPFHVVAPLATISAIADRAVDLDGDGAVDELAIDVALDVDADGTYRVATTLIAEDGARIAVAAADAALATGAATVTTRIGADDLRRLGVDGPYRVDVEVDVIGGDGAPTPVDRELALTTGAVAQASLQRDPIELEDGGTYELVDTNGNGQAERLRIEIPVYFKHAGTYRYNASLQGDGLSLPSPTITVTVPAGTSVLAFEVDGAAIGAARVPPPYTLRGLLIIGAAASLIEPNAYEITDLGACVFEGCRTVPTCERARIEPAWARADASAGGGLEKVELTGVIDPDGRPVTVDVLDVRQDERVGSSPDALQYGPGHRRLKLRRQAADSGDGRVYHVRFLATDQDGDDCTGEATMCVVPADASTTQCGDGGALFDSLVHVPGERE